MDNKFIHTPIKPYTLNQTFGENKVCVDIATGGRTINCDGLNPPTGYKSVYSKMKGHNGTDLGAYSWQPCYASQRGIVAEVSTEVERGLGVGIVTSDKYFCNETGKDENFLIRYWHFWANNVEVGQEVKTGDLIGYCGSTGYSTGVHLHLEVKPVKVRIRNGKYYSHTNILQDNGFFGAVDPKQYMSGMFALDFAGVWKQVKELIALVSDKFGDAFRK